MWISNTVWDNTFKILWNYKGCQSNLLWATRSCLSELKICCKSAIPGCGSHFNESCETSRHKPHKEGWPNSKWHWSQGISPQQDYRTFTLSGSKQLSDNSYVHSRRDCILEQKNKLIQWIRMHQTNSMCTSNDENPCQRQSYITNNYNAKDEGFTNSWPMQTSEKISTYY